MGFLANFKIRNKLLVAMLPLALMAIGAGGYSSIESKRIDTWYSNLIDNYVKTFQSADPKQTTGCHASAGADGNRGGRVFVDRKQEDRHLVQQFNRQLRQNISIC